MNFYGKIGNRKYWCYLIFCYSLSEIHSFGDFILKTFFFIYQWSNSFFHLFYSWKIVWFCYLFLAPFSFFFEASFQISVNFSFFLMKVLQKMFTFFLCLIYYFISVNTTSCCFKKKVFCFHSWIFCQFLCDLKFKRREIYAIQEKDS